MIRVKIIENKYASSLEENINDYLRNHPDTEIVDIKYSGIGSVPAYSTSYYSAMIIYKL